MLKSDEHLEYIGRDLPLIVSSRHTFGTDALLLASFSCPRRQDRAADLGTGCGIIPFYWIRSGCSGELWAVDIQSDAVGQLGRSLEMNPQIGNLHPLCADSRNLQNLLPYGAFDTVVMNPPYKPVGTGILSCGESEKIARHETACSLDEICLSAAKLLRFGGKFSLCLRPERLCDMIDAMRNAKLEPKRMRFVCQTPHKAPWLVLAEGRRGGKPGLTVLPDLYVESEEMEQIAGEYREVR